MPHVLHTIWVDKQEPTNPDTLWIRPMKKGQYGIYVYGNTGWKLITADFKGTIGEFVIEQLPEATEYSNGVMSKEDKAKLDALGILYNTTAYWNANPFFIPPAGNIVIYSDYKTAVIDGVARVLPGIKIGSGNAYVQDLNFITGGSGDNEDLYDHINDTVVHVSQEDRNRWDMKLNVDDEHEVEDETLIFIRN